VGSVVDEPMIANENPPVKESTSGFSVPKVWRGAGLAEAPRRNNSSAELKFRLSGPRLETRRRRASSLWQTAMTMTGVDGMGNGALAIGPKLPRPSSTLPLATLQSGIAAQRVSTMLRS
jgi:hypothetical protein